MLSYFYVYNIQIWCFRLRILEPPIIGTFKLEYCLMCSFNGHYILYGHTVIYLVFQVNSTGAKVLEYISDFGKPSAPLPAAIVACVPKKVHVDGIGETEFKIAPSEITDAIKAGLEEPIEAEPEVSFLRTFQSSRIELPFSWNIH